MLMRRKDVAQVRSIKDVFKGRQYFDPDMGSDFSRYEAVGPLATDPKIYKTEAFGRSRW